LLGIAEVAYDFADSKDPDRDNHKIDPLQQFEKAEGEARNPGVDVGTDDAEQETPRHHGQRLDRIALGQDSRGDQGHQHE